MKKYLIIFLPIFLLAPQLALAEACSIWFDANPITSGQGTYLRWSFSQTDAGDTLSISNIGAVQRAGVDSGYYSGAVWIAPGGTTGYSGSISHTTATCSAVLYVNPANPCPNAIESFWGGGTFLLWSGATRRINTAGYNFCISNSSGYHYFVPGRSGRRDRLILQQDSVPAGTDEILI